MYITIENKELLQPVFSDKILPEIKVENIAPYSFRPKTNLDFSDFYNLLSNKNCGSYFYLYNDVDRGIIISETNDNEMFMFSYRGNHKNPFLCCTGFYQELEELFFNDYNTNEESNSKYLKDLINQCIIQLILKYTKDKNVVVLSETYV